LQNAANGGRGDVGLSESISKGLPKDRRLRADGIIIRALATIRTDGFFVRAGFANMCALRQQIPARCAHQPRSIFPDTHHPEKLNGVLKVTTYFARQQRPRADLEIRP
jgi:hypothetical protein